MCLNSCFCVKLLDVLFVSLNESCSALTLLHVQQHSSLTVFLSRESHLGSMVPRVRLGSMWFRTFTRKTCKQWKTHPRIAVYFHTSTCPWRIFFSHSVIFTPATLCYKETQSAVCLGRCEIQKHIWKTQLKQANNYNNKSLSTLKGVADSGFIWINGAIRTTPANSVGLSQAVRMEIAPPWARSIGWIFCEWPGNY